MTDSHDPGRAPAQDVLAVIVNFNAGAMLLRAVDAMIRQTYRNFRLVIVDNASSDDSVSRVQAAHPGIEILHAGSNLGFAAANNLAVNRHPGSRWIALLNPDAFPEATWLQSLVEAAASRPDCASFASRTLDAADANVVDGAGDAYHVFGRYWRRGHGCATRGKFVEREDIFSACAAAALYARAAWEAAGGLDEDFFCYGEDVDLGFRLQLAGFNCLYVAEAIALHHGSALTGRHSEFSTYHGQRNLVWVYVKNMPSPLFWLLLPFHVLLNVAAVIGCALRGQGRVALRAKRDALSGLPRAWRKRAGIQRRRVAPASRIWNVLQAGWPGPHR